MTYAIKKPILPALQAGDMISCKVVALIYPNGLWRAVQGPADEADEVVAITGDIIPEAVASKLFESPVRQGLKYRA